MFEVVPRSMLDLSTSVLGVTVTLFLQTLTWLLVWLTQRHLHELKFIVAAFAVMSLGMLLLALRYYLDLHDGLVVLALNYAIHIGLALFVIGVARFLGQPISLALVLGNIVFVILFWPAALILDPWNVALRVLISDLICTLLLTVLVRVFLDNRDQPRLLRWIAILVLVVDIAALSLRSVIAMQYWDAPDAFGQAVMQAWYFFFFNIFIVILHLLLLLLVGVRLTADLRQKNEALTQEVQERRRLQAQLSTSLEAEQTLLEEQRQLLRIVSHEFRTPLAVIDRATEMIGILMTPPPAPIARRLDSIHDATGRLQTLINRFLVSEQTAERLVQAAWIDVPELFAAAARSFAGLDQAKRLRFEPPAKMAPYGGDTDMLTTVLTILIDNALKYASADTPVTIGADCDPAAIRLWVRDRGMSLPAAEMAMLGRRFFRGSNSQTASGSGLGLYIARRLLEYHQGQLTLRAMPEGGLEALVILPLPGLSVAEPQRSAP